MGLRFRRRSQHRGGVHPAPATQDRRAIRPQVDRDYSGSWISHGGGRWLGRHVSLSERKQLWPLQQLSRSPSLLALSSSSPCNATFSLGASSRTSRRGRMTSPTLSPMVVYPTP